MPNEYVLKDVQVDFEGMDYLGRRLSFTGLFDTARFTQEVEEENFYSLSDKVYRNPDVSYFLHLRPKTDGMADFTVHTHPREVKHSARVTSPTGSAAVNAARAAVGAPERANYRWDDGELVFEWTEEVSG